MKDFAAAACLILVTLLGCSSPRPLTPDELAKSDLIITEIKTAPVEYQLLYLDSGQLPRGTDVNAGRIRFLLKNLSQKTGDSPQQIADRTSTATSVLKEKYGKAVTHQRFLEEANDYFDAGGPKTNYNDLATLLTIIMGK